MSCYLRGTFVHEGVDVGSIDVAHESVMGVGNPADDPFSSEFLQASDGKDDVDVLLCIRVVVVVVGDHELFCNGVIINLPIGGVTVAVYHVKGLLVLPVHPRCGNERSDALRQGLLNRSPWDALCLPGLVCLDKPFPKGWEPRYHLSDEPVLDPSQ